jgi:pimeloyl-ACP methyl ester carboxylesterase
VENKKRDLALRLIRNAFDRNGDGKLDAQELATARLILYGHSFGGAAVVKLARQLKEMGIPVLLTIQIDSVGIDDQIIPSNVARAANLYEQNGLLIRGQANIRAEDPQKTAILGNFKYDYTHKDVDRSGVPPYEKIFAVAHGKIASDREVWGRVEEFILREIHGEPRSPSADAQSSSP